ncbi:TetR/AcrR family transcriptional regulator [Actinomadura opuntiae]|uniref:TetR/AcrR family transcriptional regulator n=1 Tax=Actinomadura sp. OS1-43 TaxID=604315 RepID=UPI00255AD6F2|nr:TetR/AcrR family transcriptional regulator [Actinomadura sp. OS1-43]MDL4816601.1 helix-turn-helix domain-containing protein [Actinomadura sp. OS1-43]
MRADARRNLERILAAARDVIVERGPDVPLDDIARRAEVGSGTLYRRFPDRDTLLHAVALDALTGTLDAVREACEQEDDPFDALAGYLRRTLDLRVSAVLPALLGRVDLEGDPELAPLRKESLRLLEGLVSAAHEAGTLPDDVTFGDIGMMAVRLARPLPGPLPEEEKHALARRHLDLFIRGLRAQAAS